MKKSLLAMVALSAVAGVAQADVTLYGVLDVGIATLTNAGDFSPTFVTGAVPIGVSPQKIGTVTGMMNGGESQTRWGIKGSEDLGNGNKAFFKMESAFSLANGSLATSALAGSTGTRAMVADTSLNGQMFNRMALVGLSNNELGALSFGRQYSLQLDIIGGGYDPVNAQMFSPINFSGAYGGGGTTDNSRVDNAVKYSKKFGNFNLNALYGFGGIAGNDSARGVAQINAGYEGDRLGVQLAAQNAKDTTNISGNAAPNTVNVRFVDTTSYMLVAKYKVTDPLSLKAGYEREQYSAPSNYGIDSAMTTIYSYNIGTRTEFTGPDQNINVYWVGANYQFTPAVLGSIAYYDAETPSWGKNASGSDKYTSAMVEYYLSKRTNLYAAYMHDEKSGTSAAAAPLPHSFDTYGVGIRHMF